MKRAIPTFLTLLRIAVIPVAYLFWQLDTPDLPYPNLYLILFALFVFASFTDFLDGWLARKWNVVTPFGSMLDQIADKLLVCTMLFLLVYHDQVPTGPAIVIILREIYISGLREALALRGVPLPVGKSGKWKTAMQMIGIALTLLGVHMESISTVIAGHVLLILSAILAVVSAVLYTKASWRGLRA